MNRELVSLAKENNYICPDRFASGQIIEYDIQQANINILFRYGVIDKDYYIYLQNIPKINREIIVGNMIREDKKIYNIINKGIKEYKVKLFESNDIKSYEVIRIANDAVYVNRIGGLNNLEFDNIRFVPKTISTCYLKLYNILFFINLNNPINVDIKGLGDNYDIHEPIISIIVNIINELQYAGIKTALQTLNNFIDDYINRRLDVSYYRELNPQAQFRVIGGQFFLSTINNLLPEIDIGYNLSILRELFSILSEIYTSNYRKM